MATTEKKINWIQDFAINELLHERSQSLAGIYTRMSINKPNHQNAKEWDEKGLMWAKYERTIKDMIINSQEEGYKEADRLSIEFKTAFALEKAVMADKTV